MNIKILVYTLFLAVITQGELITILRRNYWKEVVYQENDIDAPIPNDIQHLTDQILVFTNIHTLSFMQSDFTKPKILASKTQPSQSMRTVNDEAGNMILNVNGYLFHTLKKTGEKKIIVAQDLNQFKEIAVDEERNIAYMIGQNSDGSLGKLFAFNTNEPVIKANQILVNAISILGHDIKAISLDNDTGTLAYVEANEKVGWKLILLAINDFKLIVDKSEDPSKPDYAEVVSRVKSQSGLRSDFNDAIKEMTVNILTLNNEECDKSVRKLLIENKRLRGQLKRMGKMHRYLLKGKGIYLSSPKYSYVDTTTKYQKFEEEYVDTVRDVEKNITHILNEKTIAWLDEGETICDDNSKWIHKPLKTGDKTKEIIDERKSSCGIMKTNPAMELFPWTVAILGSSLPHKFICYGTLIHPKVVLISLECSEIYEKYGSAIVRSGVLDASLLNTEQPTIDRKVIGKIFTGIRTLILDEEFSVDGRIEVACSTLEKNATLQNSKCYGLPKRSSMSKAEIIDFSDIESCDTSVADSRFMCIKQKKVNLQQCKSLDDGMYNHAIYCPIPGDELRYILYGTHLRWHKCTQVIINQKVYDRQIVDELAKLNIDMKPFF